MELLLTVAVEGAEHELRVDVDADAPVDEVLAAVAAEVRAPIGAAAWLERIGAELRPEQSVHEARLRHGDRLVLHNGTPPLHSGTEAAPTAGPFELRVVGGADAGHCFPLGPGRDYTIGRGRDSTIVIRDDQISRRHLHLGVGSKAVAVTDLGSRNGTFVDGRRVAGTVEVQPDQVIEAGATLLALARRRSDDSRGRAAISDGEGRLLFSRPPRVVAGPPTTTITLPVPPVEPHARRIPLSAALVPLALGVVMAQFLGPVMLLFSLMGPVMMVTQLWEDKRSGRRDYAAAKRRFDQDLEQLEQQIQETYDQLLVARRAAAPDPSVVVERIRNLDPTVWERRLTDPDSLSLRLGTADQPSNLRLDGRTMDLGTTEAQRIEDLMSAYDTDPAVPVDVDLRRIGVLGVCGEQRDPLLRWLVLQAATFTSPRDVAVVTLIPPAEADQWAWIRWLPHTETLFSGVPSTRSVAVRGEEAKAMFQVVDDLITQRRLQVERGAGHDGHWAPAVLLVTPGDVSIPKPALSRVLSEGPALGVFAIVGAVAPEQLPGECRAIVRTGPSGNETAVTITGTGDTVPGVMVDGVPLATATELARRLAPLQDVTAATASGEIPRRVLLLDLLDMAEPSAAAVRARWDGHRSTGDLAAPIGVGPVGPVAVDLRRDGPHGLTAGTTGAGKSELLQSMIGSLAATYPADTLTFVLVDYKGGAAFKDCVALPHTVGFFTDLDAHLAQRALVSLNAELRRREHILRDHGAKDLIDLERRNADVAPANLFIVFDEFAFLKKEVPEFVAGVIDIAQRGRSLGVHLMLATQRPSGVVDDNIRANTNLRIALRMADETDSTDILDRPDAARLPKSLPGRAFVRVGHSEITPVQSAYANARSSHGPQRQPTDVRRFPLGSGLTEADGGRHGGGGDDEDHPTDLQRLVAAIREAHRTAGVPDQPRPWLDPLDDVYDVRDLLRGPPPPPAGLSELSTPLGVADLPAEQSQSPWWLDLGLVGHVLVYGTGGSGKTQILRTLGMGLASRLSPADLQLYGIDFGGRGLRAIEDLPHCGAVVCADEPERVDRLLAMLEAMVAERKATLGAVGASSLPEHRARGSDRLPFVVVLFDGYAAFHQHYLNVDRGEHLDRFTRLIADGRAAGVHFAITADRRNAVPSALSSAISARFVLRMADADEYASLGLPMAVAEATLPPGRGFFGGGEVQIAVLGDDPTGAGQSEAMKAVCAALEGQHRGVARAPRVEVLPDTVTISDLALAADGLRIPLGLSDETPVPLSVDLDHVPVFAVLGPDQSGRTNALAVLTHGFFVAHPGSEAYLLAPRRTTLTGAATWCEIAEGPEACDALASRLADLVRERLDTPAGPWLVVIDDGDELVDSPQNAALSSLVRRGRDAGLVVLAAVQVHTAHRAFGGWVTDLRKAKHGVLLVPDVETDGELLGLRLPRKASHRFPTGRGFLVRKGAAAYVQVALAT